MNEEDVRCAVCLETIKQNERTTLPCSCTVDYCSTCWDRSLAASFNSGQDARCPTCRTSVRVDFDSDSCTLKFSRLDEAPSMDEETKERICSELGRLHTQLNENSGDRAAAAERFNALLRQLQDEEVLQGQRHQNTVERLAQQAIPAMTRILQRYHAANDVPIEGFLQDPKKTLNELTLAVLKKEIEQRLGSTEGCVEKSDVIERLLEVATGDTGGIAGFLVSAKLDAPACVCGSLLERVHSKERTRRFLAKQGIVDPQRQEMMLESMVASEARGMGGGTNMICDVCDNPIHFKSCVWTCRNEDCTILHATTYDVCDICFQRHACAHTPVE